MCAMQCTILIETCSQCTNSSIFNLNLPSKLAGMQVLQNGRRFGSTRDPQNFQKFCFVFYNISKPICNVSHLFLSLFSVNRLVNGEKVRFQPIVQCRNKGSLMIIQVKTVFFLDNTEKFEKLKIIFFSVYALKKEWKS